MALTEQDAIHFLGRVGFIPSDQEIAHFVGREIDDVVNEVLTVDTSAPAPPPHVDAHDDEWRGNMLTIDWWFDRMQRSRFTNRQRATPNPLLEKLTLFWHGHFASEFQKVTDAELMWQQNDIFRSGANRTNGALGDFEQLCQEVSLHGAMLVYLDNESNVAGAEQENFARELMELFTMGIGNYSENDVVEMARAWTGHGTIGWVPALDRHVGTYQFRPDRHDYGQKTIFGITADWDGPATITEICRGARQEATARFVSRKLWRFFVNGGPTDAAIDQLASTFIASNCSIREVMRALLTHPDFWAPASRNALVKTPTQFVVDFARRTGVPFNDQSLRWLMRPMGQVPFDPPNVAGWGTNGYWLSTATMWGRARFAVHHQWPLANEGFLAALETTDDSTVAINHLLKTFGIRSVSNPTYAALQNWFTTMQDNKRWALAPTGISLIAMTPEFQVI